MSNSHEEDSHEEDSHEEDSYHSNGIYLNDIWRDAYDNNYVSADVTVYLTLIVSFEITLLEEEWEFLAKNSGNFVISSKFAMLKYYVGENLEEDEFFIRTHGINPLTIYFPDDPVLCDLGRSVLKKLRS